MGKHSLAGLIAGLGAAAIWGGMYVVSKVVLDVIPPFTLLTIRLGMGVLVLWGVILLRREKISFHHKHFRASFAVGIIGYGISLGFQFVGTRLSTASNGALVTSATPAFVLLFAQNVSRRWSFRRSGCWLSSTRVMQSYRHPSFGAT
jgi:drug/metabolite transporter (DMT)-like permease